MDMGKITVSVRHRNYDELLTYEGVTLEIMSRHNGKIAHLTREDNSFTAHRVKNIKNITIE